MTTKSYSKHKEYKEFSSSRNNVPYTDEQFDMIKSELLPKGSKLETVGRNGVGTREYHYEYKEEKHPSGKYDRKDLHTVEEYTIPPKSHPKSSESNSYYYEREDRELPAITTSGMRTYNYETTGSTPAYSKVKNSKVTKEISQNVEELDSLLDDLQKDQERQLYKGGYTSDTAESSSFDYKRGTPIKAPSSGYSTLKREERVETSSWGSSPPPPPTVARTTEMRQQLYREENTESRVVPSQISPAVPLAVPAPVCHHCHHQPSTGTLPRASTPMNKVTTTVKTYTYEVPADQDPTTVPIPTHADHQHSYVTTNENLISTTTTNKGVPVPASPALGGCQYCSHCNTRLKDVSYTTHLTTSDEHSSERLMYPGHPGHPGHPGPDTHLSPDTLAPSPGHPRPGHTPHGPTTYKYSETSYSSQNTTERFPSNSSPLPITNLQPRPPPSSTPTFPRSTTPSPSTQQPPKKLDDLLADFPEARFPTQPDGVTRRRVEVSHETHSAQREGAVTPTPSKPAPVVGNSKNVVGPAVYYPPGHTPFANKPPATGTGGYQYSAMQQGGGAYASGRGMYEYESGSRSKEKHSEKKTAVPICLPLCCAMPCVIL